MYISLIYAFLDKWDEAENVLEFLSLYRYFQPSTVIFSHLTILAEIC